MRTWTPYNLPLFGAGEENAAAPLASDPQSGERLENCVLTGPGTVAQCPDWRLTATLTTNGTVENFATCGIFPFATQGSASAPSAGIAFSYNSSTQIIYLHQLGEDGSELRRLTAYATYAEPVPPQMTGFELFGKFYFCEDGREGANRKGMAVYDPVANTVTIPTYDNGGGAEALKFRGIACHPSGMPLGWGYDNKSNGLASHLLRYSKYTAPDTWVPDTTETSADKVVIGKLNVPIVAVAQSGRFSVIGKETEVFILGGDYSSQLYTTQIAVAHGPTSVTGMASNGPFCVWWSDVGPMLSANGATPQQIATNRLTKRLQTYYDLTYCCATHDGPGSRFAFLLRRRATFTGTPVTNHWPTEILFWDYIRDQFYVRGLPTATAFCLGTIKGPGTSLPSPVGVPTDTAETNVNGTSVQLNWTNADNASAISVEYKLTAASTYTVANNAVSPGLTSYSLTNLTPSTSYDRRERYYRNGTYGSYSAGRTFVTAAASSVADPTNVAYSQAPAYSYGGKTYMLTTITWTQTEFSSGATSELWEGTTAVFTDSTTQRLQTAPASTTSGSRTRFVGATNYWYWARQVLSDGTVSNPVLVSGAPITYGGV